MKKQMLLPGIAAMAALIVSNAQGIPPPWSIEEMKAARASVILIGRVESIAPVENDATRTHEAAIVVVKLLKGDESALRQAGSEKSRCKVTFSSPSAKKNPAGPRAVSVGGPGDPKILTNDVALVFLKQDPECADRYHVVLGSFGYITLNAKSDAETTVCKETIQRHLTWCGKIENPDIRKAMTAVYRKALRFVLDRQQ